MHRQSGFTLLEILITLVVLAIGIISLVRVVSLGIFADTEVENRMIALSLAMEKMEELKDTAIGNFNDADLSSGTHSESVAGFPFVSRREWVVSTYGGALLNRLKDLKVQVFWESKGSSTSVELETLLVNLIWAGS